MSKKTDFVAQPPEEFRVDCMDGKHHIAGFFCMVTPGRYWFFDLLYFVNGTDQAMIVPVAFNVEEENGVDLAVNMTPAIGTGGKPLMENYCVDFSLIQKAAMACLNKYDAVKGIEYEKSQDPFVKARAGFTIVDGGQTRH